jgi:hypothetical protein
MVPCDKVCVWNFFYFRHAPRDGGKDCLGQGWRVGASGEVELARGAQRVYVYAA